jgi:peptide/nickel transport system substrate-binding protein
MTLGILPKHIWQNIPSEQMLYSEFNTNPIGSGSYKIESIAKDASGNVNSYTLIPNEQFALGRPYLKQITLKFYLSEKDAIDAYKKKQITSISGVSPATVGEIIQRCDTGNKCEGYGNQLKTVDLPRIFAVFFNQNKSKVLLQKEVRQALLLATDKEKLVQEVLKGYGKTLQHPIPKGTLGALEQEQEVASTDEAKKVLEKNGWKLNQNGIFEKELSKKEVITLEFSISTSGESEELKSTALLLKEMWEKVGAKVDVNFFETGDLQKAIAERNYESLLFGESIGHDPDPFVFWHSSQKNYPGSNVAMYTNSKVDKLLEDARKTLDAEERISKYKEFQEEVQKDIPAVFLFSPSFIYAIPSNIQGTDSMVSVTTSSERFSQVYKWYTQTNRIWKIFAK